MKRRGLRICGRARQPRLCDRIESTSFGTGSATRDHNTAISADASDAGSDDSVALGANTVVTADNQVNVGGRTIAGGADGDIAAGSDEAVTGGQIFTIPADQAPATR